MRRTIYLCDLCPPDENGERPEVVGSMHTVKLSTHTQGVEKTIEVDACGACKDRFFPITT